MSADTLARFRAAAEACSRTVFWQAPRTPAETLGDLGRQAAAYDLSWDRYGAGGAVEQVEAELVERFGVGVVAREREREAIHVVEPGQRLTRELGIAPRDGGGIRDVRGGDDAIARARCIRGGCSRL